MTEQQVSFPALGSIATVVVSDPDALAPARSAVEQVVDAFDRACSRFRQSGWRRPPAEFVDPEIVVLKKVDVPAVPGQLPTR